MIIILKNGDAPVTIMPGESGVSVVCESSMTAGSAIHAAAIIRKPGSIPHPADRHMPVAPGKRRLGVGLCLLSFCLIGLAFGRGLLSGHASPSAHNVTNPQRHAEDLPFLPFTAAVPRASDPAPSRPYEPDHNVTGPQRHAEDLPFPPTAPAVPRASDPAPSRPDTPATVNTPFGLQ
ncbi:hypothetical protein [Komagataeibacter rhaeticus]|uniref:hypothetical protein n=1 Tax=Komagataeibacter rhaeticus TaxID=215221 RepID=UPI001CD24CDF|nr:hypothetical protein [Komagataeibacter rhaeticus]